MKHDKVLRIAHCSLVIVMNRQAGRIDEQVEDDEEEWEGKGKERRKITPRKKK